MILHCDVCGIYIYIPFWISRQFDEHFHISLLLRFMKMFVMHIKQLAVRSFGVLRLHFELLSVIVKSFFCFIVFVRLLNNGMANSQAIIKDRECKLKAAEDETVHAKWFFETNHWELDSRKA